MSWRVIALLMAILMVATSVSAQGEEDNNAGDPVPPVAPPQVDSAVVLFDYQAINEPLTRLELSITRVMPRVTAEAFSHPDLRFLTSVGPDFEPEETIWREAWTLREPRGTVEFIPVQETISDAVRSLDDARTGIRSMRGNEALILVGRAALVSTADYETQLLRDRLTVHDRIIEADGLLRQARQSLEDTRAALLSH